MMTEATKSTKKRTEKGRGKKIIITRNGTRTVGNAENNMTFEIVQLLVQLVTFAKRKIIGSTCAGIKTRISTRLRERIGH